MLAHELAGSARERGRETFHLRLLEHLAPQLVDVPLQGGEPWAARHGEAARRARRGLALAAKASGEARRRAGPRVEALPRRLRRSVHDPAVLRKPSGNAASRTATPGAAATRDPFVAMRDELKELVLSTPQHRAWDVLKKERVEALLTREPGTLDEMSRLYVWRLATAFGAAS